MPPRATACAECAKRGKGCRRFAYCLYLQAESASSQAAPLAAAASAGGASHSKRGRKKVQRFEPGGKVEADRQMQHRKRKLQDAKFAPSKEKR